MLKTISIIAAMVAMSSCFNTELRAQYGGAQVRIGGYGSDVHWRGYGNGYGNGYGYGYGNGNGYGYDNGFGNSYRYGNSYQLGYRNYGQPNAVYYHGGGHDGFHYRSFPATSYGFETPQNYTMSARRLFSRRYR